MFTLAGCDNGTTSGNGNGGGVPSGPGTGGNPVLGSGEIWVWDDDTGQGIRFENSNFCYYFKNSYNNTWGSRTVEGTWSGSTITYTQGSFTTTFTVSDNKLYEYSPSGTRVATYTKTTGQTGI
jgi:hypothetical protein